jgi:hypothetical protein
VTLQDEKTDHLFTYRGETKESFCKLIDLGSIGLRCDYGNMRIENAFSRSRVIKAP